MRLLPLGRPWTPLLLVLAVALALDGVRVFALAQALGEAPPVPPGPLPSGWPQMIGSLALGFFAVCHAWITSAAGSERRRADRAEEQIKEMVRQMEELSHELKAIDRDRDEWMKRAYSRGYQSSDAIPVRKDLP